MLLRGLSSLIMVVWLLFSGSNAQPQIESSLEQTTAAPAALVNKIIKKVTNLPNTLFDADFLEKIVKKLNKKWSTKVIKKFNKKLRHALKKYIGTEYSVSLEIPQELQALKAEFLKKNNANSKVIPEEMVPSASKAFTVSYTKKSANAKANGGQTKVLLDLRNKYPFCKSLGIVRDQSNCGSCWAVVTANTVSDRHCIKKGSNRLFSAQDILECCSGCLNDPKAACDGGYVHLGLFYLKYSGTCSGETYNDFSMCKPYFMAPDTNFDLPVPKCRRSCVKTSSYSVPYTADRLTISDYRTFSGENEIITQLETEGTVIVTFDLYEDFFIYSSGVYEHIAGEQLDVHSARVIGYGIEKGVPYWLCVNSWGTEWGENGYFKIKRGENECNIEFYWAFAPVIK